MNEMCVYFNPSQEGGGATANQQQPASDHHSNAGATTAGPPPGPQPSDESDINYQHKAQDQQCHGQDHDHKSWATIVAVSSSSTSASGSLDDNNNNKNNVENGPVQTGAGPSTRSTPFTGGSGMPDGDDRSAANVLPTAAISASEALPDDGGDPGGSTSPTSSSTTTETSGSGGGTGDGTTGLGGAGAGQNGGAGNNNGNGSNNQQQQNNPLRQVHRRLRNLARDENARRALAERIATGMGEFTSVYLASVLWVSVGFLLLMLARFFAANLLQITALVLALMHYPATTGFVRDAARGMEAPHMSLGRASLVATRQFTIICLLSQHFVFQVVLFQPPGLTQYSSSATAAGISPPAEVPSVAPYPNQPTTITTSATMMPPTDQPIAMALVDQAATPIQSSESNGTTTDKNGNTSPAMTTLADIPADNKPMAGPVDGGTAATFGPSKIGSQPVAPFIGMPTTLSTDSSGSTATAEAERPGPSQPHHSRSSTSSSPVLVTVTGGNHHHDGDRLLHKQQHQVHQFRRRSIHLPTGVGHQRPSPPSTKATTDPPDTSGLAAATSSERNAPYTTTGFLVGADAAPAVALRESSAIATSLNKRAESPTDKTGGPPSMSSDLEHSSTWSTTEMTDSKNGSGNEEENNQQTVPDGGELSPSAGDMPHSEPLRQQHQQLEAGEGVDLPPVSGSDNSWHLQDQQPETEHHQQEYSLSTTVPSPSFFHTLYMVVLAELAVLDVALLAKLLVAHLPILKMATKRRTYQWVEYTSAVYRAPIPWVQWMAYLYGSGAGFTWIVITSLIKIPTVIFLGVLWIRATVRLFRSAHLGTKPPSAELADHEHCTICYSNFVAPIKLCCGHIFCTDCIRTWLDKEQTCPVCRAVVTTEDNQYRGGESMFPLHFF